MKTGGQEPIPLPIIHSQPTLSHRGCGSRTAGPFLTLPVSKSTDHIRLHVGATLVVAHPPQNAPNLSSPHPTHSSRRGPFATSVFPAESLTSVFLAGAGIHPPHPPPIIPIQPTIPVGAVREPPTHTDEPVRRPPPHPPPRRGKPLSLPFPVIPHPTYSCAVGAVREPPTQTDQPVRRPPPHPYPRRGKPLSLPFPIIPHRLLFTVRALPQEPVHPSVFRPPPRSRPRRSNALSVDPAFTHQTVSAHLTSSPLPSIPIPRYPPPVKPHRLLPVP